jgi:hypothetical protein
MLELMPDGETFKKLGKAQSDALARYYKREKDSLLDKTVPNLVGGGIPVMVGISLAAMAYVFKEQLVEEKDKFIGGVGQFINEGIWDNAIYPILSPLWRDPKTPEYVNGVGPLSRCQRWETDLVDIEARETGGGGIDRAFVVRKMKDEGCDRPGFVEVGEWGRV